MTDSELKGILDSAEAFWRRVSEDNGTELKVRPKRKRPPQLAFKPHIMHSNGLYHIQYMNQLSGELYTLHSSSPTDVYRQLIDAINHGMDWDRILSGDFLYIDYVLMFLPSGIFALLPPLVQEAYE